MAKRALCIGINNYPGTGMDLRGCINDAKDWSETLSARGFAVGMLLDEQATKQAMVAAIRKLVHDAAKGDSLVITYSGHGTFVPDRNGDEADGLDEALCPYDIVSGHALIDDEIHQLFAQRAAGVRIVLISDSCHSGTVIRAAAADPDADGARPRFMPMAAWLPEASLPRAADGKVATRVTVRKASSPWAGALSIQDGGDLLLAGCEEGPDHFSYDATIAGRANGAFTYYALKALKRLGAGATYAQWHAEIRKALPSANYQQTPQLFGGEAVRQNTVLS